MKIISNFKDYYDYLQGIYGVDEKIVYERIHQYSNINGEWIKNPIHKPSPYSNYEKYYVAICDVIYAVYIIDGNFYFGLNYYSYKEGEYDYFTKNMNLSNLKSFTDDLNRNTSHGTKKNFYHLKITNLNSINNCPVLLVNKDWGSGFYASNKNIKLSDFGVNQIISPNDMYLKISQFLSKEKEIKDSRTNKEKIVGNGFDLKTSFRNI